MSVDSEAGLRALVLERLGLDGDLPVDVDLVAEGLIDSFGFLELVVSLEDAVGAELDLEQLPVDDLTRLGPLCAFAAAQGRA